MEVDPYTIVIFCVVIWITSGLIAIVTLLISVLSLCVVPQWRTFKNYVFLNIVLAFNMIYFLPIISITSSHIYNHKVSYVALDVAMNFFMFAACCWLMVMAMIVYTDLVTVFGSKMTRKVLKSTFFGWGLPGLITLANVMYKLILANNDKIKLEKQQFLLYHNLFYYEEIAQNCVLIILLLVNFVVYLKVVWSLLRRPNMPANRRQQLKIATLAFVMSGILLLVSILMTVTMLLGKENMYYLYPFGLVIFGIQTSVINIQHLRTKSIIDAWKQHFNNKRRIKRDQRISKFVLTDTTVPNKVNKYQLK